MCDTVQSLHNQLIEAEENLRLVQERKAKYVMETDVPLQIIKEERRLEGQIADLQAQLAQLTDTNQPPVIGGPGLPGYIQLFFNLVIGGIAAFVVRDRFPVACVHPMASAGSQAIILLLLSHLVWRYLNPVVNDLANEIKDGKFQSVIKVFASLLDALHPSTLSNGKLWLLTIALSVVVGVPGHIPALSPFRSKGDPTPVIQTFSVRYLDETTLTLKPGDTVEIMANEQVLVETLPHTDPPCAWSSARGTLQSAEGCATLYSAPFEGTCDTLVIMIQSACEKRQSYAGLHINIVQARSSP